jgi:outer membrane protein OmpA-like peptidoglycan-associated protein
MDLKINKRVSLRVFEADYQLARMNFSHEVPPDNNSLRRQTFDGVRLSTGLVFNFGGAPELPVSAACSVQTAEVMQGEPVHVTVAGSNFNPKHTLTYDWKSSGGKVEGKDTGATIDTNGVAGGSYTATATVTDSKVKKNGTASCTANFSVKEPPKNPPQFSCSVSPTTLQPGTSATITCTCTSPDNVPVTVGGWTASGGTISGSGNTATLNTTGASPGTITTNATCTDSRGLTASSSTSVSVENPPPPPPQATKLNECTYPNAKKPWRVDNTCKAALDDVALRLQQDPEAKLVVVGNAEPSEKRKNLAAERAADVKFYISSGEAKQNIDPSRIEVRTGTEGTAVTEHWIVPSGATFPEADGTTAVDESKVKAVPDHPKPVAKKKAAKKAQ